MPISLAEVRMRLNALPQQQTLPPRDGEISSTFGPPMYLNQTRAFAGMRNVGVRSFGRVMDFFRKPLEGIRDTTQSFRWGVLTAFGKVTPDQFVQEIDDTWKGTKRLTTREFNERLWGRETWQMLESMPFIPGWTRDIIVPEWADGKVRMQAKKVPRLSMATVFDVGAELLADPFTYLAFTPVGSLKWAEKLGPVGRLVANPYRTISRPLSAWIGPESENPLAFWNLVRQPVSVFTGKARPLYDEVVRAKHKADEMLWKGRNDFLAEVETAGLKQTLKSKDSRRAIGAYLQFGGDEAAWLTGTAPAGRVAGGQVMLTDSERRVVSMMERRIEEGFLKIEQVDAHAVSGVKSRTSLADLAPRLVGMHGRALPRDVIQSFDYDKMGRMNLVTKEMLAPTGKLPGWENLDGWEAFDAFLQLAERKANIEPVLLRFVPKRHPAQVMDAATLTSKFGWDPITAELSPVQRRYLISWANEFTGHGRGRSWLMFDTAVAHYWDKQLSTNPVWKRVENLAKITGHKQTIDGLYDWSPTTKIAGAMTHNIFRSAVGGTLRSALTNASQIANTGVMESAPAMIKGMLRLTHPDYKWARANVDLMRDYQAIFSTQTWQAMRTYDEIIFAPFNAAEKLIRGTAFNAHLGKWMKERGVRDFGELRARGLEKAAFDAAHFASLESSFVYGVLGTSPYLMNPAVGPARALISYPFKQAEFLHAAFKRDGSAFMRFLGLHGWLIEQTNNLAGISGERMFGWGFVPRTRDLAGLPLVESPPVRLLLDTTEALWETGRGNYPQARRLFEKTWGSVPGFLKSLGAAGISPLPMNSIAQHQQLVTRLASRKQRIGEGFVPISQMETVLAYAFGQTTRMQARQTMRDEIQRARWKVDDEMDRSAGLFVKGLSGHDGDALAEAVRRMAKPIYVGERPFWPETDDYFQRIERAMLNQRVSKDVIALGKLGVFEQLFAQQQMNLINIHYR